MTGREITSGTDIRRLLCDQVTEPVRLAEALCAVAAGVDLLLDTGPGQAMAGLAAGGLAAGGGPAPIVSLGAGPDGRAAPAVAAALFAVGAVASLGPLLAGRPARQIDICRPRLFISNPCAEVISAASAAAPPGPGTPAGPAQRPDSTLLLGSPGLNDAVMHMLQACVPDRRVRPAGFRSLTLTGQQVSGAVQVRAERAAGPAGSWQVTALDATGLAVLTLTGLRLREAGRLAPGPAWHPTLLAAAIEGRGAELGLDPALRVTVRCGLPEPTGPAPATELPWNDASAGTGMLTGFQLTVQASMPVACHWETIDEQDAVAAPEELARQLDERYPGQPDAARARLRAITACLAAAGGPDGTSSRLGAARDVDWAQVRAGQITVACTVAALDGVPQPVVIALATWPAGNEPAVGGPADSGHGDARDTGSSQPGPPGQPTGTGGSLGRHSVVS